MESFQIINLGDGLGDCFLIQIKNSLDRECVILVDGRTGTETTGFMEKLREQINEYEKIDYMVITHIDYDHVGGIIKLLQSSRTEPVYKRLERTVVIYNYVTRCVINYDHADILEEGLLEHTVISTSKKDYVPYSCPVLKLLSFEKRKKFDVDIQDGGYAYMTLLHPDKAGIDEVYHDYEKKQRKGSKYPDKKLVNRQSIAFLLEFAGKKVLFGGDGYIKELADKVEQLKNMTNTRIDLIKIPHHGAKDNNGGLVDFSKKHQCSRFIVTGEKKWSKVNSAVHPAVDLLNDMYNNLPSPKIYSSIDMTEYEHSKEMFCDEKEINV